MGGALNEAAVMNMFQTPSDVQRYLVKGMFQIPTVAMGNAFGRLAETLVLKNAACLWGETKCRFWFSHHNYSSSVW